MGQMRGVEFTDANENEAMIMLYERCDMRNESFILA